MEDKEFNELIDRLQVCSEIKYPDRKWNLVFKEDLKYEWLTFKSELKIKVEKFEAELGVKITQ